MALREIFAKLAFDWDARAIQSADKSVDGLVSTLQGAAGVLAGGALIEGIKHFAEQLDVFDDLSAQTHVATGDLQELGYAAKISGSSAEEMFASLSLLQKGLGKADAATSPQAEALKKLGITAKDAGGEVRDLNDILPDIYENFNNLKSGSDKAQVATALFGRAGVKLIPTLERGAEGIKAIHDELEEFGGVVSEDTIAQAGEFRDNLVRLDTAFFALKGQLASAVFPQLSRIVTLFGHGVGRISDFAHGTTLAEHATTALSVALAVKLGAALAPYLKQGLKFAAIFFAIDDVMGFLEGKDSEIGFLLNKVFGTGTDDVVRGWVNRQLEALGQFKFKTLEEFVFFLKRDVSSALDNAGRRLKSFGDKVAPLTLLLVPAARAGFMLGAGLQKAGEAVDYLSGHLEEIGEAAKSFLLLQPAVQIGMRIGEAFNFAANAVRALLKEAGGVSGVFEALAKYVPGFRLAKALGSAAAGVAVSPATGPTPRGPAGPEDPNNAAARAARVAADRAPTLLLPGAPQIGPLRADIPASTGRGNFVQVNHNAPAAIIQVPPGTSAQVVKAAGNAAVAAIQGERRAALEALQQAQPD